MGIEKQENLLFNKLHIIFIKVALFIGLPFYGYTQELENLVLNPSFEEHFICNPGPNNINNVNFWFNSFDIGTPGYYSSCNNTYNGNHSVPSNECGYQDAHSGTSYGFGYLFKILGDGSFTNSQNQNIIAKEPLSGTLKTPLQSNTTYYFEFWVNKCDNFDLSTNAFDLMLHIDTVNFTIPQLPYINQGNIIWSNKAIIDDSDKWKKLAGCFKARGGEKYFSIGAFRDTNEISWNYFGNFNQTTLAAYYFDDFLIYQCDTCCPDQYPVEDYITVNNNLITQGETATFETFLNEGHTANLYLFDSAGRIVYQAKLNGTDNSHQIPYNLAAGVYHYAMVTSEKKKLGGKIVVIN